MFVEESQWVAARIAELEVGEGDLVVDVGSSTREFRCLRQPYIDYNIFRPLRNSGAKVVHVDQKELPGVDRILDIASSDADLAGLEGAAAVVICTNLLEHVPDRGAVFSNLKRLVRPSGHIVVTVPSLHPYHADPIDTMYRPSPEELRSDLGPEVSPRRMDVIEAAPNPISLADGPTWRVAIRAMRLIGYRARRRLTMPQQCLVAGVAVCVDAVSTDSG